MNEKENILLKCHINTLYVFDHIKMNDIWVSLFFFFFFF